MSRFRVRIVLSEGSIVRLAPLVLRIAILLAIALLLLIPAFTLQVRQILDPLSEWLSTPGLFCKSCVSIIIKDNERPE